MMSQTPLADELARISREEFDRYIREFRPTEQDTIASLNEASVGRSMDDAQADAVRSRAALQRMRERYGVGMTAAQTAGEARQSSLSGALGVLTAGNQAADFDLDNKRQTLAGLLNIGQGIRQQAMGGFSSAAEMENSRNTANAAAKTANAQQKAANRQAALGAAASIGMMAMMM